MVTVLLVAGVCKEVLIDQDLHISLAQNSANLNDFAFDDTFNF